MFIFGFIQLNPWPAFYLSLSVASGYYAVRSAYLAIPKFAKGPFGSKPLVDRVETATKEVLSGKFSPQDLMMGTDSISKRTFYFLSGVFLSLSSLCLAVLAYEFYLESLKTPPIDYDKRENFLVGVANYKDALKNARIQSEYWQKSLCQFDANQWETAAPQLTECFKASSVTYDLPRFFWENTRDYCERRFSEVTLESNLKDIIPRHHVDTTNQMLQKNRAELGQVGGLWLGETGNSVNEKCSYLFPYFKIDAEKMCGILRWLPFSISEGCTEACSIHQNYENTLYKINQLEIPRTTNIVINCTEAQNFEDKDFVGRATIEETIKKNSNDMTDYLYKEREKIRFKTYSYNWRNLTSLNQDFIFRRYEEVKDYDLRAHSIKWSPMSRPIIGFEISIFNPLLVPV